LVGTSPGLAYFQRVMIENQYLKIKIQKKDRKTRINKRQQEDKKKERKKNEIEQLGKHQKMNLFGR
jgi:hypothetical protein